MSKKLKRCYFVNKECSEICDFFDEPIRMEPPEPYCKADCWAMKQMISAYGGTPEEIEQLRKELAYYRIMLWRFKKYLQTNIFRSKRDDRERLKIEYKKFIEKNAKEIEIKEPNK